MDNTSFHKNATLRFEFSLRKAVGEAFHGLFSWASRVEPQELATSKDLHVAKYRSFGFADQPDWRSQFGNSLGKRVCVISTYFNDVNCGALGVGVNYCTCWS